MLRPDHPEVGLELKVSELQPKTIIWLQKPARPVASVWVLEIFTHSVWFRAGAVGLDFLAQRTGPDLEQITDDSGLPMKMYAYLGAA